MLPESLRSASVHTFLFRCTFCFVLLFVLSLPFPYSIIPNPGMYGSLVLRPLVAFTATSVFNIQPPYTLEILSDSTGMYVQTFLLLLIAICCAASWSFPERKKKSPVQLRYFFHAGCAYYLSLQLLKYGADKLFKHQFYLPESNTLHTQVGDLSRDILYWSSMGSSYSYSIFLGLSEIIPGLLLLFPKTRRLGALIAFAVLINVVMINFSFDISVKVYSCFLLLLSGIVAMPAVKQLYHLFIHSDWNKEPTVLLFNTPGKIRMHSIAKALIVGLIFLESLWAYVKTENFNDDAATRPYVHGAWKVTRQLVNGDTITQADSRYVKKLFAHRQGYLIFQDGEDRMHDYRMTYNTNTGKMILTKNQATLLFQFQRSPDLLILKNDSIEIISQKIDLTNMPLLQKDFHWTIDSY